MFGLKYFYVEQLSCKPVLYCNYNRMGVISQRVYRGNPVDLTLFFTATFPFCVRVRQMQPKRSYILDVCML